MEYHAKLLFGNEGISYWSPWDKENLIKDLIIPFINGQVILHLSGTSNTKAILNLKTVSELKIFKTESNFIDGKEISAEIIDSEEFEKYDCTEEIINEIKIEHSPSNMSSLLQKTFAISENQAFVIMKFGDKLLDSAYEGVIKPLFIEFGLNVIRVDEIQDAGKISDQILEQLAKSKIVFSDLSGERPNCYYETGFAHALGKEMILSIHKKDKIHFDLAGHRFIEWETESELRNSLKKRLQSLLNK